MRSPVVQCRSSLFVFPFQIPHSRTPRKHKHFSMGKPQYATNEDLAAMEAEHDTWLEQLDTSHIKPLDDDWAHHPFWADARDLQDDSTEAGQLVRTMQDEFTPEERASGCKVCTAALRAPCFAASAASPHKQRVPSRWMTRLDQEASAMGLG